MSEERDIVERLGNTTAHYLAEEDLGTASLLNEAASEITRLRGEAEG